MKLTAQNRNQKGNMLIVVLMAMTLACVAGVVALSLGGVYLSQTLLQDWTNSIALSGACSLNGGDAQDQSNGINSSDRIGQMNNLTARSRAEVFESSTSVQTSADLGPLHDLAEQLHESAVEGAQLMETERQKLRTEVEIEARDEVRTRAEKLQQYHLVLPWIQMSAPKLATGNEALEFGHLDKVQSNVMQLDPSNSVSAIDQNTGVLHTNHRYLANKDARLPVDGNLDFKFSSLEPPVKHEVAPARLIMPSSFAKEQDADMIPSAVRVVMVMDVQTQLVGQNKQQLKVISYATTAGGGEMR